MKITLSPEGQNDGGFLVILFITTIQKEHYHGHQTDTYQRENDNHNDTISPVH